MTAPHAHGAPAMSDLGGDASDVTGADLDVGQFKGEGGVGVGLQSASGFTDHAQEGGAVAVAVKTKGGP